MDEQPHLRTTPRAPWTSWRVIVFITVALVLTLYPRELHTRFSGPDPLFDDTGYPVGRDYVNLWSAARLVLDGRVNELFDPRKFHEDQETLLGRPFPYHNWSYPPHLIPWILGLGFLPYLWGLVVWLAGTFAAYIAAALAGRRRGW